jgi:hypothetical protein
MRQPFSVKRFASTARNRENVLKSFIGENTKPSRQIKMRTFSCMSNPDKALTKKSYLLTLSVINQKILSKQVIPENKINRLRKEALRLRVLIDALDTEIQIER